MEQSSEPTISPTDPAQQFRLLMQRVQEGDEAAAEELVEHYGTHIIRVVRRRLHPLLRSKFDSIDFVQSVWASFFALPSQQYQFDQPARLIQFLVTLAQNKVVDTVRERMDGRKHDVRRELSLDDSRMNLKDLLTAHQPTPEETASAQDEWDHLFQGRAPYVQRILTELQSNKTHRQVAEELGLNVRTIRRAFHKAEKMVDP